MPDETLDRAADAGALATEEQIGAQAGRMLADDRAREGLAVFHRFYLGIGSYGYWELPEKDPNLFPLFDATVAAAMLEETERFFDAVTFDERGTFRDLFSSPLAFVNSATAPIYGLDPSVFDSELQRVALDPNQRPGFLSRIGFLAAFSGFDSTSPILRGAYITRDVLGIELPAPEPTANSMPSPSGVYYTNREYIDALTSHPECAGCHDVYINPPGFVLEAYDTVGSRQTVDSRQGVIDTVADVYIDGAPVTVADPADLMQRIAGSSDARRTYVKKWITHAYDRAVDPLDECTIDQLSYQIARGDTLLELFSAFTQTAAFRLRTTTNDASR
jgi:hypothetical protein